MQFKIIDYQRKRAWHTYWIEGEKGWGLLDLIPKMLPVSKRSTNFAVVYSFDPNDKSPICFVDNRDSERTRSALSLERTLDPRINKVKIFDDGVGKQMIDKCMRSIET